MAATYGALGTGQNLWDYGAGQQEILDPEICSDPV